MRSYNTFNRVSTLNRDIKVGVTLFSKKTIKKYLDDFIGAKESLVAIVVVIWTEGDRHFVAKWSVLHMFHIRSCIATVKPASLKAP